MTVEELDIIVQASVEGAIKEFNKLLPTIKQQLSGVQKEFDKLNIKDITANIDLKPITNEVKKVKKQIQDVFDPEDVSGITFSSNVIDEEDIAKVTNYKEEISKIPQELEKTQSGKFIGYDSSMIQNFVDSYGQAERKIDNAKSKTTDLNNETQKVATTQSKMSSFFSGLVSKIKTLGTAFGKISGIIRKISSTAINVFGKVCNTIKNVKDKIKDSFAVKHIKGGLGHILKYAGALFSLRGIYSILSSSASSWLSSQNEGAKQLSANIEYMKTAMGSALAPVIQFVTNLIYQLMKAIQSVVYAFSGINIFAKATASSMNAVGGSAKKAKQETKQLAGIHNEINNISDNKNGDSGSSGGGTTTPSIDLSQMDTQLSPLAQKLIDFFAPLKESWDNYGTGLIEQLKVTAGQVSGLISSVWESFEKIITNGTVYTTLELILAIIGNIAEAFANAWNYNGNGDAIVQNLANAFNNLLGEINNVVQSDGFQIWLNNCSDKCRDISQQLANINWEPLVSALMQIGTSLGTMALEILNGIVSSLNWFSEHPEITEFIATIATGFIAIGIAVSILSPIITPIVDLFKTLHTVISIISPFITETLIPAISGISAPVLIIIGVIAALIAVFVHLYNSNEDFRNKVNETWQGIVELFQNYVMPVIEEIKTFIGNVLDTIWGFIKDIWDTIEPFIQEAFETIIDFWNTTGNDIVETLSTILKKLLEGVNWLWQNIIDPIVKFLTQILKPIVSTVMGAIVGAIKGVLDTVSTVWNTVKGIFKGIIDFVVGVFTGDWEKAWEGVKNIFWSIVEGLGNLIKIPINFIIDCVNGFIKGLNKIKLPDWAGGQGINISLIPRLAKGGVLYDDTIVRAGEYSGASSNPEIVTPQNIMYETTRRAFEDAIFSSNNNNGQDIHLTLKVGDEELGQVIIDTLGNIKRNTGKGLEALVGG